MESASPCDTSTTLHPLCRASRHARNNRSRAATSSTLSPPPARAARGHIDRVRWGAVATASSRRAGRPLRTAAAWRPAARRAHRAGARWSLPRLPPRLARSCWWEPARTPPQSHARAARAPAQSGRPCGAPPGGWRHARPSRPRAKTASCRTAAATRRSALAALAGARCRGRGFVLGGGRGWLGAQGLAREYALGRGMRTPLARPAPCPGRSGPTRP
jgi:hypothetical protein